MEFSPVSSSAPNRAKEDIGQKKEEGKKGKAYIVVRHGKPFPGLIRYEDGSVKFFKVGEGVPKKEAIEDLLIMSRLPDNAFVELTAEELKRMMRKKDRVRGKTR